MGSILTRIYDHYEDYLWLCEQMGVKPKEVENFLEHEEELLKLKNGKTIKG